MKRAFEKLITVLLALFTFTLSHAQWSPPPPLESMDLPAANAATIVAGKILEIQPESEEWPWRWKVTVQVSETLKGKVQSPAILHLRNGASRENFFEWRATSSQLLIAVPSSPSEDSTIIDLNAPNLAVFTYNLKLLHQPREVLQAVRDEVRLTKGSSSRGRYIRKVYVSKEMQQRAGWSYVPQDRFMPVSVPIDGRLERYGQDKVRDRSVDQRIEGIRILANYKTAQDVSILREKLSDNGWTSTWNCEGNKVYEYRSNEVRRTAYQALQSLQIAAPEPITEEPTDLKKRVVSADVGESGTVSEELAELLQYPNLTDLSVSNVELSDHDLQTIGRLAPLQMLYFQGSNITDSGLANILTLRNLIYINLANTSVTDRGLMSLAEMPKLKKIEPGSKLSEKGMAEFRKLRPDVSVEQDEFAFLNQFHPRRVEMGFRGRSIQSKNGEPIDVWRYGLIFPPETAITARKSVVNSVKGWKSGDPGEPQADGFHRFRSPGSLPDGGRYMDTIFIPKHTAGQADEAWGVTAPPGGLVIVFERRSG